MEGLGDRIGHHLVRQDFAVGHAHIGAQTADASGHIQHLIVGLDLVPQTLVQGFGVKGQQEPAGEEGREGPPELGPGLLHSLPYHAVTAQGLFDPEEDVLNEHHGGAHIHRQDVRLAGDGEEAQLQQVLVQAVPATAAAQGVGVVGLKAPGQELIDQLATGSLGLRGEGDHTVHHHDAPGGVLPDIGGGFLGTQGFQKLGAGYGMAADPAQGFLGGAGLEEDAPAAPVPVHGGPEQGRQRLPALPRPLKVEVPGRQDVLKLRRPEVEAVGVDVGLNNGIHQDGDVQVLVHIFPDLGGADSFAPGGQRDQLPLAPENLRQLLPSGPVRSPAEDHVVVVPGGAGGLGLVGGGAKDHVAASGEIQLSAREFSGQGGQILGACDVDGHVVREKIDVPQVRHGDGGHFSPQELGNGSFAPGEFIDGQVDLQAHAVNGPNNFLMPGGEGVKGAGEEGHGPGLREAELCAPHLAGDDEAVQVVQHGGVVVEGERVLGWFLQEAQELFPGANQAVPPHVLRDLRISKYTPAEYRQGGLVDERIIVGDARE